MHRNIDRRRLMKTAGAMALAAAAGAVRSEQAFAQQVPWSSGTESPKLKAPANACDCHMHIYDAKYPTDPKATLKPPTPSSPTTSCCRNGLAPVAT